ncbi:MAG: hypothetical protein K0Q99_2196 [Clostridia bacterium]|jgi:hypothetical protein|nr:hypothetical protein [Clostridia bacterium]
MGRMTIKKRAKKKRLPYDAEMNDMREWQDNMYNPGYYVGTGKIPYPLKNLARHPKLKLAYFLWILIPIGAALFFVDFTWYNVVPVVLVLTALVLIIWDSRRIMKKKNKS